MEDIMTDIIRKDNDFNNLRVADGKVYGLTMSYHFNVRLSESDNPSVCPKVNFDGMPVETLCKKAWDAMKVSARPSMKKLTPDQLNKLYNQEIDWSIMVSQAIADARAHTYDMSSDQLDREIERLMALKDHKK